MKKVIAFVVTLLVIGGAVAFYFLRFSNNVPQYRTAKVTKGDLFVTVSATGTVQPFVLVQVGTQVTGNIKELKADFNTRVKAGQLVARIDPAPFQAVVDQNRANLARAKSDVERVKANLVQAEKELGRSQQLAKKDLISGSDLDAAQANYDSLAAQLKVAQATVDQNKAACDASEVNLGYTKITSPIDGIVVSRNVDVGQTVAASLSAPTLFVIADGLKRVQVQARVAEADIGRVTVGQKVHFTVDAHRDLMFRGSVSQIRLQPTEVQNVVTYTVVIDADNPEEKLLPGMTANVSFEIAEFRGVLKVPNAVLRFTPAGEAAQEAAPTGKPEGKERRRKPQNRVWVATPQGAAPKAVTVGATDGTSSEISGEGLSEGLEVITGLLQDSKDAPMSNPFGGRYGSRGR